MKSTLIVIALFAAPAAAAAAQQEPADAEQAGFKRWLEFYAAEAAEYELFLEGEPPQKLKLETSPLLTYTNRPVQNHCQAEVRAETEVAGTLRRERLSRQRGSKDAGRRNPTAKCRRQRRRDRQEKSDWIRFRPLADNSA